MAGAPAPSGTLEDRVRIILFDVLATEPERQVDAAYLVQDLGADSLDAVEFGFELEEAFELGMDELDLTSALTVGDVIAAVRRVVDARAVPAEAA
ncbi:acyl carrier protein [Methylobacterium sp. C1]|uniref:acyl carrier protein n=1 Tax=Methylobacterium sp. C1 TaxID=1479019 RepID=UPI0008DA9CB4|nr:acyl carrier protein [Methylobacterium sp. C1]